MQGTPNRAPKAVLWIVLVVLVAGVIGLSYYVYQQDNGNSNTNAGQNANANSNGNSNGNANGSANGTLNQNVNSGANANVTVNTSKWSTYENPTLGFKIKYPTYFTVFQEQQDGDEKLVRFVDKQYLNSEVSFPSVLVSVFQVNDKTTLTKWVEDSLAVINYQTTIEDITTKQNLSAKKYQSGSISKKVAIQDQNRIYTISFAYYSEDKMQNEGNGFTDTFELL